MTKLSDAQLVILSAACARDDRSVLPLTTKITGGARDKVLRSLRVKKLTTGRPAKFDDRSVHNGEALFATDAAFEALGMDAPAKTEEAPTAAPVAKQKAKGKPTKRQSAVAQAKANGKDATKADLATDLLRGGTTVAEIMAATGWLPHTTRARISNMRKAGAEIVSSKEPGGERVYRLA